MQLLRTAAYYMEKYKRPIVLVLDQIDRIAKQDPRFLGILQDFAKDCADKGTIVIVFIASEGLVPQIMKCRDVMIFNILIYMVEFLLNIIPIFTARSAWSRAITLDVGDIADKEAVKFLQDSGIDEKKAEDAVKYLTGGRFTLLKEVQILNRVNPKNLFESM